MKKIIVYVVVCLLVITLVGCGSNTPKSTMEKWIKSIEEFNAVMVSVTDKEVAKKAIQKHITELQGVMAEIREWSAQLPAEKKGDALKKELELQTMKVKDKAFVGAYLAGQMNALRFSLSDSALKIEYDTFISLDKQIRAAYTTVGADLDKFGEAKTVLTQITKVYEDFAKNLATVDSGPKLVEEINNFISSSQGLFPKLDGVREALKIKDWNENTPAELKEHVKKMKAAIKNMLMALMVKGVQYQKTPGLQEAMGKLTEALK